MSGFPTSLWDDQDAAEWSELPSDSVVTLRKPFQAETLLQSVYRLIGMPMIPSLSNQLPFSPLWLQGAAPA